MTTNRPLRVFLCHSSNDKPAVRELYQKLRAEPWIEPWLDEEELFPGMDWNMEIEKAIEATDVILVCLSNNSITKEGYVQREIRIALDYADYKPEGTLFIIPVRLEECTPPKRLARWQYADYFEGQRERGFERLLVSLKSRAYSLGLKTENELKKEKLIQEKKPLVETRKPAQIEKTHTGRSDNPTFTSKKDERSNRERKSKNNHLVQQKKEEEKEQGFISQKTKNFLLSWWARILLVILLEFSLFFIYRVPFAGGGVTTILVTGIIAGLLTYPNKLSVLFLIAGALLGPPFMHMGISFGMFASNPDWQIYAWGGILGILTGALISRILYWLKIIKD